MDDAPVTQGQLDAAKREILEAIESVETKLLTAFHGWARPHEIRIRTVSETVHGFDERLSLVEERLSRLERGD